MNKRMLGELYKQAHVPHTAIDPSNNMPYETTCFSAEKFAELIVEECAKKCEFIAVQAEITNTGEMARKTKATADSCAKMIKQYFGVEE